MANVITIKDSITAGNGPTELLSGGILMGELAINTNDGILFAGADPGAHVGGLTAAGTAAGAAVVGLDNIMASPLWTVHNTDLGNGQSSISDQIIKSGVASKPRMTLENNNADDTGAIIKFLKDGANAADNDKMGELQFYGEDDAGNKQEFGNITVTSPDVSTTAELGKIAFGVACSDDGGVDTCLTITGGVAAASSTVAIAGNLTVAGTTTTENTTIIENTVSVLQFEGTTDNAHETILGVVEPAADCTFLLPTLTAGTYHVAALTGATTDAAADVTPAEFSYLDGVTSAIQTQIDTKGATAGSTSILTVGALDAGSITSNFGTINNGASTITTTGLISGGSLDIDDVLIDGATIGHTDDTDLITLADESVTIAGTLAVTTFAPTSLAVGGGYGDTGATISAAGVGQFNGALTTDGILTCSALTAGNAVLTEAELEKLDGITNGTAAASKAMVTDASNNIASLGTLGCGVITSSGNLAVTGTITGDTSLTLDSTTFTTAELGVLDGVTVGTIAASKALTLDASSYINNDLKLKTGDGAVLHLNTSLDTVIDGSIIGAINFTAPDETGTDAITLAGAIEVVAEAAFTASVNSSEMVFKLGLSGAAASKMTLSSAGALTTTGAIVSGGAVTGSTGACYEAGGTDVAVTDGGTGLSTAAKGSILHTTASNTIAALDGGGSTDKLLVYDYSSDLWTVTTTLDGGSF
jgi:hypothetical protein